MKALLDTSVLVATFYADHVHHLPSIELFRHSEKSSACCSAHNLAEVYSSLTGMPGKNRVTGDQAMLFLENIRERLTLVTLTADEYFKAIAEFSVQGITGGGIYDALIGRCALKAEASVLYTWNVKDFQRLGPAIAKRVRTP